MDAVEALVQLGGIAPAAPIVARSSRQRLRTAVKQGRIVRAGHNRYALPVTERGLRAAQALHGHLSHLSAAMHHGWPVKLAPEIPQLTLPPRIPLPEELPDALAIHRRSLPPADRDGWATTPLRTVLDCARDLPFDEALAVADSALRAGDVDADELLEAATRLRGPDRDRALLVARHATPKAANPFESVLRALALQAGLETVPQWRIQVGQLVFHADLANPLVGLVLEADSWTWHAADPAAFERDCVRYNAMTIAGWAVLRFTWEHVMRSPAYVVATIRALLPPAAETTTARHAVRSACRAA